MTNKQEKFATEFVKLGDASAAYRAAYNCKRMKPNTINVKASELLKNGKVSVRVRELQKEAAKVAKKHFEVDSKEILGHLNILRQSRIDEYVELIEKPVKTEDSKGNKKTEFVQVLQFKPFERLTEQQLMCIESIKHGRNGIELKLHGKDWTIDKISRHIGFYAEDNYQQNPTMAPEERRSRIKALQEKLNKSKV